MLHLQPPNPQRLLMLLRQLIQQPRLLSLRRKSQAAGFLQQKAPKSSGIVRQMQ